MSYLRYSVEFKQEVLIAYEKRDCTVKEICSKFGITIHSLNKWMRQFKKFGVEGLKPSKS